MWEGRPYFKYGNGFALGFGIYSDEFRNRGSKTLPSTNFTEQEFTRTLTIETQEKCFKIKVCSVKLVLGDDFQNSRTR